jgi:hypothetical protein
MICKSCAEAADEGNHNLHQICEASTQSLHCTCQHRVGAVVIKKDGANVKENNGDGS